MTSAFAFGVRADARRLEAGVEDHRDPATDGQAATNSRRLLRFGRTPRERCAASRFFASCKEILDVTHAEVLDYRTCANSSLPGLFCYRRKAGPGASAARRRMWSSTFGMDGAMNTHPDHTIGFLAFTTAAFHWAASPKRFPHLGPVRQPRGSSITPRRPSSLVVRRRCQHRGPSHWTSRHVQQRQFRLPSALTPCKLPLMEKFQSFFEQYVTGKEVGAPQATPS